MQSIEIYSVVIYNDPVAVLIIFNDIQLKTITGEILFIAEEFK